MNSYDAIYDACLYGFRPILMTGMCAILGILPLALGYGRDGSSRIPLGLMVVGGISLPDDHPLRDTRHLPLHGEDPGALFKPRTTWSSLRTHRPS